MGRKKACDAKDGTWVLLTRLVALVGLLVFETDHPGPPKAPPDLHPPEKGAPRLDGGERVEGRVCDDIVEAGRTGSLGDRPADNPVTENPPLAVPSG